MKLTSLLILASAPTGFCWRLRWGPLDSTSKTPKYSMSGYRDLTVNNPGQCMDFRRQQLGAAAKDPAPGWVWWQPTTNQNHGCCLHLYGSGAGFPPNHNCRRLDGGERYLWCDDKVHKRELKQSEGIGSYRILGCKTT